ncbi:chitinase-like protein Idgf1 [Eurosta solidaginis]|uniref:chitinase-like protein Idgf1 n=1 Tax=Eurosta solidaginis TaxID=178769 RepID=UPI00353153D6
MRAISALILLFGLILPSVITAAAEKNLICFYDSASYLRPGFAKLLPADLELGLHFCSHLIYGYAGLKPHTFEVYSLNVDLDMFHYHEITLLKAKYPKLKVFLSVGGDHDLDEANPLKYIGLLEADRAAQQNFIDSSISLLKSNGFDGLDLAFQLPRNKPRKVHGAVGSYWKQFKKLFTGDFIVDPLADEHKTQFTDFSRNLRTALQRANLSLSLTVLPNVNSTWYFDVPKIKNNFDFINLLAFDFLTPERNPDEADYTAPIYPLVEQDRLPHYNIEFQVDYWLQNQCPPDKINLGIATYGRAWKMTSGSGFSGVPVVILTDGPAPAGSQSLTPGLLSWPEICAKMPNSVNADYRGENAPLRKVTDLEQRYGNYALRPADDNGEHGMWVSYDDPDFGAIKSSFVRTKGLGGVAIYDLSYDDFRGLCTGLRFPILRAVKHFL